MTEEKRGRRKKPLEVSKSTGASEQKEKSTTKRRAEAASKQPAAAPIQKMNVLPVVEGVELDAAFDVMTERANKCGKPPTKLRRRGKSWMICYLMSDCSYARCKEYKGPIPSAGRDSG